MIIETFLRKENQLKINKEVAPQYNEKAQEKKTHAMVKFGEENPKKQNKKVYTILAMCK